MGVVKYCLIFSVCVAIVYGVDINCVQCSGENCKDPVDTITVTDKCPLDDTHVCARYSYNDKTVGALTVRDCVTKTENSCDDLKATLQDKIADGDTTWACYACDDEELCNKNDAEPVVTSHCVQCSDYETCAKTVDPATVIDRCDLAAGKICETYSYKDATGTLTVRGCIDDTKTCETLKTENKDKITEDASWGCYTCKDDLCNTISSEPVVINHCVQCSDYEACAKTVDPTKVTDRCELAAGKICETYSYKDATGTLTVRGCIDDTKTCDALKTENIAKATDAASWGCYTCKDDLCNTISSEPVVINHCVQCSDYETCAKTVDPTKVTDRCELAAGKICETYSYKDATGTRTVRGCIDDTKTCDDLKTENKDKITDDASWGCYTCKDDLCNTDTSEPVVTNHCVQCSDYETCAKTVDPTKVTDRCELAAGKICETYSYKDATGTRTVRGCIDDTKTCDDLKTENKDKIADDASWGCYTCKDDLCNTGTSEPVVTNHCVQCSDYETCAKTVDPTKVTDRCELAAGKICETYSYKDATGTLTVRGCIDDTKTCEELKTENIAKATDAASWGCYTCKDDLCNTDTSEPVVTNHCVQCSDYETCANIVDPTKVTDRCELAAGKVCETYSYKDATGTLTVRGCIDDTKTCDTLKTENKDKITEDASWGCYTCKDNLCNVAKAEPVTGHCVQCSDHDACSDTVDTNAVTTRCDLVDGTVCERHSYKDATGTLTTRSCIAKTKSCEDLKADHKADFASDSSWQCYICEGDLCNKENSAGSIGLSLLLLVAGALISMYFK